MQNQKLWKKIWHNEKYEAEYWSGKIRNSNTQHILNPRKKKSGYLYVKLTCTNHQTREYLVHRLVAQTFKRNRRHHKLVVNHKNKIKTMNNADNLEWLTHKQNNYHKHNNKQYLNY